VNKSRRRQRRLLWRARRNAVARARAIAAYAWAHRPPVTISTAAFDAIIRDRYKPGSMFTLDNPALACFLSKGTVGH
jgi:hypothetical protein